MLGFARPWLLALLFLPITEAVLAKLGLLGSGLPFSLLSWGSEERTKAPLSSRVVRWASNAMVLASYALCVFAAAGPTTIERRLSAAARGPEIVFILDCSPSMSAADIQPNRFEAARALLRERLAQPSGASYGLVAFGAEAALVCPPTRSAGIFLRRLDSLSPGRYGDGTAIGDALALSLQAAAKKRPGSALVLLTDGESNAGHLEPQDVAEAAYRAGLPLFVIGFGKPGAVPIEYADPATGLVRSGSYESSFDGEALARLASKGGGSYRDAVRAMDEGLGFTGTGSAGIDVNLREWSAERPAGSGFALLALLFGVAGLAMKRLVAGDFE